MLKVANEHKIRSKESKTTAIPHCDIQSAISSGILLSIVDLDA